MAEPKKCAKKKFKTRLDALIALSNIQRIDNPARPRMERRAYQCPICGKWHLTSQR